MLFIPWGREGAEEREGCAGRYPQAHTILLGGSPGGPLSPSPSRPALHWLSRRSTWIWRQNLLPSVPVPAELGPG